jgi:peptidoglycan/LPS O-acetylase OafA/YrhL
VVRGVAAEGAAGTGAAAFAHQPALDGVRAVAVVLVLLFHGGVSWMTGGYLGVSVFFTLSGYLITSLLLREEATTGRIAAGAFYARRARRLLPASLLCLVAIVVGAAAGLFDGVAHLRRDLYGALFQVANWVQLLAGESYADLLQAVAGERSPLDHFWSLAIEEQLYWIWPVAVAALVRRRPAGRRAPVVVWTTAIAALAAPLIAAAWGPDAAYFATPARAAELLAGAALACLWQEGRVGAPGRGLAPVCLVVLVALSATLPVEGGLAYRGGLPLVALLSAGLLHGLQAGGPARTVLSWAPLVALGRISYGVYLFHWPIYVVVDEERTGWDGAPLLAVRLLLTLAVAVASFHLLELPVRRARWAPRPTGAAALGGVVVATVLIAGVAIPAAVPLGPDADVAAAVAIPASDEPPPPVMMDADQPSRPVRVLLVGDSTAMAFGTGLTRWAAANPDLARVTVWGSPGCGFFQDGVPEVFVDTATCREWLDQVPSLLADLAPDAVVLMNAGVDLLDRSFDGAPLTTPADPTFAAGLRAAYAALTAQALDAGAWVGWVRPPIPRPFWGEGGEVDTVDAGAWPVLDEVLDGLAATAGGRVEVLDLRAELAARGLEGDRHARPDGIHLDEAVSEDLVTDWLGEIVVAGVVTSQAVPVGGS